MTVPGQQNIVVEIGATFLMPLLLQDGSKNAIDVTGYEAKFQIRNKQTGAAVVLADSLNTGDANTSVVVGTTDGSILVRLEEAATALLAEFTLPDPTNYRWGIMVKTPGDPAEYDPLLEGTCRFKPGIVVW